MKRPLLIFAMAALPLSIMAQNWDHVRTSGEYYYGIGHGTTEEEASQQALNDMLGMIATHVTNLSDFPAHTGTAPLL